MNFQSFGSRRFIMTMGCGIVTTALCWFGKIDGTIYAAVISATVAVYIAGNTTEKIKAQQNSEIEP